MPSPFQLRARFRRAVGLTTEREQAPAVPSAPTPTQSPTPPRPAPQAAAPQVAAPQAAAPQVAAPQVAASQASTSAEAGTRKVDPDKIEQHRQKARRGVLKWLAEQGGHASMKDMHDFSERRFFVAHKPFSDMMEFYIDQRLITFDHAAGLATLTEEGRAFFKD